MELFSASASLLTPVGWVVVKGEGDAVTRIYFSEQEVTFGNPSPVVIEALTQLQEYFTHPGIPFTFRMDPAGTSFQQKVWNELRQIPYGQTLSYGDLAHKTGDIKAIRAVAAANGANPLLIVVPCHRVVGLNGKLTGYAAGLERKSWLLNHEKGVNTPTLFAGTN